MKLYSENKDYKLYQGSMLDMLKVIEPNTIDSIVTDPPYELNFMGKGWDNSGIAFQKETWKKCYEVLKPGGYLLAFGGSRTFHRIACAIEDAGFEIRDTIMWLYGSGFPKSMNISLMLDKKEGLQKNRGKAINTAGKGERKDIKTSNNTKLAGVPYNDCKGKLAKQWQGWGTALKPSFEPIIVARKPFKGRLVDNVIEYGVGGINIDECRVGNEERTYKGAGGSDITVAKGAIGSGIGKDLEFTVNGRFPANTILTYDETPSDERLRYFYCAKASKKDRDEGLDTFIEEKVNDGRQTPIDNAFQRGETLRKNTHPTVKPTDLMQYLVRLVTPSNGIILDPFNGSGSTGKAVMYENKERNKNYKYIGIELTEEYLPIAKARIEYICNLIEEDKLKDKQLSIFDLESKGE